MNVIADLPDRVQQLRHGGMTPAALQQGLLLAAVLGAAMLLGLLSACAKPEPPPASSSPAPADAPAPVSPASNPAAKDSKPAPPAAAVATDGSPPPPTAAPPRISLEPRADAGAAPAALPPFPWPPPPFSASMVIPRHVLLENMHLKSAKSPVHLQDVDAVLHKSLRNAGYEYSYFSVDRGFALVSRIERITDAGAPYPDPKLRFDASLKHPTAFSIQDYLQALFVAPPGYFRLIVFIVSPAPFTATGKPVSADEASAWLQQGANKLPAAVGQLSYSKDYACTSLIYEFEKRDTNAHPTERQPGRLSAETHMVMSGIQRALRQQPAE